MKKEIKFLFLGALFPLMVLSVFLVGFSMHKQEETVPCASWLHNTSNVAKRFEIVTLCTTPDPRLFMLLTSMLPSHVPVNIIGMLTETNWTLMNKLYFLHEYVSALNHTDPERLIMFVDALDVLFCNCGQGNDYVTSYLALGAHIVFMAEMNCYPQGPWCWRFEPNPYVKPSHWEGHIDPELRWCNPPGVGLYQYLNSGGFMGSVWAILRMTQSILDDIRQERVDPGMLKVDGTNDQTFYMHYFLTYKQQHGLALDHNATIFTSMWGTTKDVFIPAGNHSIYHHIFQHDTCILHGNGAAKQWVSDFRGFCQQRTHDLFAFSWSRTHVKGKSL